MLIIAAGLLILLLIGIPVAAALGALSLALDQIYMNGRLQLAMGEFYWDKSKEFLLVAVPMFVLLGEILLRSGIASRMYAAVIQWLSWLPGGLMHANIGTSAIFAASSGSSVATAATVGTVSYQQIGARKYNEALFLGSVAAGGTLGILIPPSIILIVYGLTTDTSIPELYLAGILPGAILAALFHLTILAACTIRPSWGGARVETSWAERIRVLPDLAPPILLFLVVIGSIYAGFATPTEAAALGVVMALLLAGARRALSIEMLLACFEATLRTTAMIVLIVLTSVFLNFVLGFMGATRAITEYAGGLNFSPTQTMLCIIVMYVVLGMFVETFAMMLTTVPLVYPIVTAMGYDPVWFGIMITVLMEMALITPPIGLNLYVVQGIRLDGGRFSDICKGATPFAIAMLAMVAVLMIWPEIATWLPDRLY
ncbi:MAG: TRAP transporter large permease [Roseovarius sp.]|nr:TRAP transporter large permease [Roseovarius sp.]